MIDSRTTPSPEHKLVITDALRLRPWFVGADQPPCRFTISLIQIGAKGEVHPLEQG
jgi:hypothetical protein